MLVIHSSDPLKTYNIIRTTTLINLPFLILVDQLKFEQLCKHDLRISTTVHGKTTYQCHKDDIRVHTVLGYLPKLKRGLKLAFGADFLHGFFIQMLFI